MSLLSNSIKMQKGAPATATLNLFTDLPGTIASRARWYKNGVLVGTFTGTSSQTLNAGDTFYVTANDTIFGLTWYLEKNGIALEMGADYNYTSSTYTASGGDTFLVQITQGL